MVSITAKSTYFEEPYKEAINFVSHNDNDNEMILLT